MGYLGVDHRPAYNECDTQLYEDSKLKGVLHWAQAAGKETGWRNAVSLKRDGFSILSRTGIVTTARITHATPGATYSHVTNRDYEADSNLPREKQGSCQDIAYQLVNSEAGKNLKVRREEINEYLRFFTAVSKGCVRRWTEEFPHAERWGKETERKFGRDRQEAEEGKRRRFLLPGDHSRSEQMGKEQRKGKDNGKSNEHYDIKRT